MKTAGKFRFTVVCALAATLTVTACGTSSTTAASGPKLVAMSYLMPFPPSGGESDIYYAKDQGYFAAQGIDLTIIPGKDSQTAVTEAANGGADIASVAVKDQLASAGKGQMTVAVGSRDWRGTTGLFLPKGSGITDLKGLEGKQVLYSTPSIFSLLKLAMNKAGADFSKVDGVMISSAALATTFISGKGDALLTAIPGYASAVAAGRPSTTLLLSTAGVNLPSYVFVTSPTYLKAHADLVKGFLTAAYQGTLAALKDPTAAAQSMVAKNPALNAAKSAAQQKDWGPYVCGATAVAQGLKVGAMPDADYQSAIDLLVTLGTLKAPLALNTIRDSTIVSSIDSGKCPS